MTLQRLYALCLFLLCLPPGAVWAQDASAKLELTPAERAWLAEHPVIRARIFDLPPINYWDNGPRGIAVDTAEAILGKLGVRLEYRHGLSWTQTLEDIRAREGVDLLLNAKRTPQREAFLAFTLNYLDLPWMIFTRADEYGIFGLEDLSGKSIAVEKNYVLQEQLAQNYPQIKQILFEDTAAALAAVSGRQADAYIGNLTVVQYHIAQRGFSNLKVATGTGFGSHTQAFAARKDWPLLASILDKGLAALGPEERSAIQRKYFAVELSEQVDYTLLWQLAGAALLIIGMVLYWNRRLAREIVRRTQAEAQYRELSERLEKIADRLPGVIFQYQMRADGSACFPYASNAIRDIYRVSPEEVRSDAGKVFDTLHPDDYQQVIASVQASARTLRPWRLEYRVRYRDGTVRWLLGDAVPEKQADESVLWHGYVADIGERKQAERQLQETGERLRSVLASIEDLVFVLDAEGYYLESCQGERANLLLPLEQFLGKHYREVMPEAVAALLEQAIAAAKLDGAQQFEYSLPLPGGERWFSASLSARRDGAGHFVGSTAVVRDITARHRMEAALRDSEARLRTLSDNLPESMIYQIDSGEDGRARRFTYVSASVEGLHGVGAAEVLRDAEAIYAQVQVEDRARVAEKEAAALAEMRAFRAEVRCRLPTGEIRWRLFTSAPRRLANGHVMWDGIETDITARKQVETELIQAREAAEAANRAKSAFLANMSHELRTPLNAVLGFAQILAADPALTESQRGQAQNIRRGGEYLLTLINDILDLAKIEAGRFELTPEAWDTQGFFQELEYMFRVRAEQKQLFFHFQADGALPRTLRCDAKRLRQILINLLGNAMKFTERGGVTLRTGFEADKLRLEVEDTGIGIAPGDIEKIFEPFQQTGENRYKAQGTGLGLAITRRLVEAMGGHLRVDSAPGAGSVFRVDIPAEIAPAPEQAPAPAERAAVTGYRRTHGAAPLRVLVVDDVADNRLVLRGMLEPLGFAVEEADSGERCLALAPSWRPDVVLMDLRMPEMDGLEATRRLRARPGCEAIPVIAVSAAAFAADREQSLAAGCDAHLGKPVHLPELLDSLGRLLPLAWDYADAPGGASPESEALSPQQAAEFLELVKYGDITGLQQFAQRLERADNCPAFAQKLGALARDFDIGEIVELAERYEKAGGTA